MRQIYKGILHIASLKWVWIFILTCNSFFVFGQPTWNLFPADITIECDDPIPPAATPYVDVTANDNCPGFSPVLIWQEGGDVSTKTNNGSCSDYSYTITRTWRMWDLDCGPWYDSSQVITVTDTTRPVVVEASGALDRTVECSDAIGIANAIALAPTYTDNCATFVITNTYDNTVAGCGTSYVRTRRWTAEDQCGNVSLSYQQVITVTDTTKPNIICQNISRQLDLVTGLISISPADIDNGTTDNCSTFNLTISKSSFNCTNLGNNTVTLTATDACGNASSCMSTVSIDYTLKPVSSSSIKGDTLCNNEAAVFSLSSNVAATTYTWTVSKTSSSLSGESNGSGFNVNQTIQNNSDSINTLTYFIQPSTYGCNDSSFSVVIKVNPSPTIDISMPDSFVCNQGTKIIGITNTNSSLIGSKYYQVQKTYNAANLSGIVADGYYPEGTISETASNSNNNYQVINYRFTAAIHNPKGNNPLKYCMGNQQEVSLYVLADIQPTLTIVKYIGGRDVSCNGFTNGRLSNTVSGGYVGFYGYTQDSLIFSWSNGSSLRNPTGLSLQKYIVDITDKKGCTKRDSITLSIQPPVLAVTAVPHNPSCQGKKDGYLTVNIAGGTSGYDPYWTGPASFTPVHASRVDSIYYSAGFTVMVTDTNGCVASSSTTIIATNDISFAIFPEQYGIYHTSCFNKNDGYITSNNPFGGTPPYTFQWRDDKGNFYGNSIEISNLSEGKYTLRVSDISGCSAEESVTLLKPDSITYTSVVSSFYNNNYQLSCGGGNDGSIAINNLQGNHNRFSLSWEYNGSSFGAANAYNINGLRAGEYTLTIKDSTTNDFFSPAIYHRCYVTMKYTLLEPDTTKVKINILSNYHGREISCNGFSDGSIDATVENGHPPYQFTWNNGVQAALNNNLPEGEYIVRLLDSSGCTSSDTVQLSDPEALMINLKVHQPKCFNTNDGRMDANPTGGTEPYKYEWSNRSKLSYIVNLISTGVFSLTLTDANNCRIDTASTIIIPPKINVSFLTRMPECPEIKDGGAQASVSGGLPPYVIEWFESSLQTSVASGNTFEEMGAGLYYMLVTDSIGCTVLTGLTMIADNEHCLDVPSVFTPNSDGVNDTWSLMAGKKESLENLSLLYPNAEVEVFNKWGTLVFKSSKGYSEEWNGRMMNTGKELPADSYFYTINLNNYTKPFTGVITILR